MKFNINNCVDTDAPALAPTATAQSKKTRRTSMNKFTHLLLRTVALSAVMYLVRNPRNPSIKSPKNTTKKPNGEINGLGVKNLVPIKLDVQAAQRKDADVNGHVAKNLVPIKLDTQDGDVVMMDEEQKVVVAPVQVDDY